MSLAKAKQEKSRLVLVARERIRAGSAAPVPVETPMLRQWAKRCFANSWADRAPRTLQQREIAYRLRIDPHLGAYTLAQITPLVVDEWLHGLVQAQGKTRAVEHAGECLRALLGVAMRLDLIDRNPVRRIPRQPHNAATRRGQGALSREQYDRLTAACRTPAELSLVRVACECGLRAGELAGLQWADIDFSAQRINVVRTISRDKGQIVVRPRKGHGPARPAMEAGLAQLLRDRQVAGMIEQGAGPDDPVWPGRGARDQARDLSVPMSPTSISHAVARIMVRAGLVNAAGKALFGTHDLRRTGASLADEAGIPQSAIAAQLGHTPGSLVTSRHYIRQTDEAAQERIAGMFATAHQSELDRELDRGP